MMTLLNLWQEGTKMWRADLGHIADAAVAWQPFARSHNISAMLLHMADVESEAIEEAVEGKSRGAGTREMFGAGFYEAQLGDWPKPMQASLEWHYAIQDAIREHSVQVLAGREASQTVLHPKWGAVTLEALILRLIQHEAYHAGQIMLHKIHYGWGGVEPAWAA